MPKLAACLLLAWLLAGCLNPPTDDDGFLHVNPLLDAHPDAVSRRRLLSLLLLHLFLRPPLRDAGTLGCQKPPEDYTRLEANGWTINQRTLAMLTHARELYGGELEIDGYGITQGSYHDGEYSFGTHLGGGAVDLSVLSRGTYTVLWDDIEPLIHAFRVAGFAAWLREYGELYPGLAHPYPCHCDRGPGVVRGCPDATDRRGGLLPRVHRLAGLPIWRSHSRQVWWSDSLSVDDRSGLPGSALINVIASPSR